MENKVLSPCQLREKFLAEYENACDYLYYGMGFEAWKKTNQGDDMSDIDAKKVWGMAKSRLAAGHRY